MLRQADAFGSCADSDALTAQDVPDSLRHILVFPGYQAGSLLDDGHIRAKPPVHLRELEANVAAADDDKMLRQPVQRQNGRVRQVRHLTDTRHVGHDGAAADIDETFIPAFVRRPANGGPAWPAPMMIASKWITASPP